MKQFARKYYEAVNQRDFEYISDCLHIDVEFIAPLATFSGKTAVVDAVKNFTNMFTTLTIRSSLESNEEACVVYDIECPQPTGKCSAIAYLLFKEGLISNIELFYDPRPFNYAT